MRTFSIRHFSSVARLASAFSFGACGGADASASVEPQSAADAGAASGSVVTAADGGAPTGGSRATGAAGSSAARASAGGAGAAAAGAAVAGSAGASGSVGATSSAGAAAAGTAAAVSGSTGSADSAGSNASAGTAAQLGQDCGKDPLASARPLGRGFFQEFRGLFGCTAPADLALYREVLPEKFDMPADPQVCFYMVHFAVSGVGPYNEAAILLPIEYAGQSGQYVLTMPLDNLAASSGGRAQGFPKYVADEVAVTEDGDNNWTGVVRNAGQVDLQASYTGACREGGDFPFPDFINITPVPSSASQTEAYLAPRTGSALMITSDLLTDPPQFFSLEGTVQMQIGDSLPWNGLFDESQAFPAQLVTFKGGIDLGSRALD